MSAAITFLVSGHLDQVRRAWTGRSWAPFGVLTAPAVGIDAIRSSRWSRPAPPTVVPTRAPVRAAGRLRHLAHPASKVQYTTCMADPHPSTITVDGVTLALTVARKPVKRVNARLHNTTLAVSAPLHMPQATLEPIVADLARRLVRRARAHQVNAEDDALGLALRLAARFPIPPAVAQVRFVTTQQACWGSYSVGTHTVRLNATLRQMPRWVLEHVVVHELAHAEHPNHSPAFWKLVRRVDPKTEQANAFLAGVSWLGRHWEQLPPVERALLTGGAAAAEAADEPAG